MEKKEGQGNYVYRTDIPYKVVAAYLGSNRVGLAMGYTVLGKVDVAIAVVIQSRTEHQNYGELDDGEYRNDCVNQPVVVN